MIDLALRIVVVGLFTAHWAVSGSRLHTLGAALPAVWTAAVVALAVSGHMAGIRDWALAAVGLLVLLVVWDRRHESGHVRGDATGRERRLIGAGTTEARRDILAV